jgi:hypothetical protein
MSPGMMALFNKSTHDAARADAAELEDGELEDEESEVHGYECTNSPRVHQPLDDTIEWACCDADYPTNAPLPHPCNYLLFYLKKIISN